MAPLDAEPSVAESQRPLEERDADPSPCQEAQILGPLPRPERQSWRDSARCDGRVAGRSPGDEQEGDENDGAPHADLDTENSGSGGAGRNCTAVRKNVPSGLYVRSGICCLVPIVKTPQNRSGPAPGN